MGGERTRRVRERDGTQSARRAERVGNEFGQGGVHELSRKAGKPEMREAAAKQVHWPEAVIRATQRRSGL